MDCTRVADEEIADQYLQGHLSEEDREAYESHFFECRRCFDELKMLEALQAELRRVPAVTTQPAPPVRRRHPLWWGVALAASVAFVFLVWSGVRLIAPPSGGVQPPTTVSAPQRPASDNPAAAVARLAELSKVDPPEYLPLTLRSEDEARVRFEAGMAAYARGDYQTAAAALEQVVSLQPSNARALFFLGVTHLMLDRPESAVAFLQRCIDAGDSAYQEDARYFLAKALLRKGDRQGAMAALEIVASSTGARADDARRLRDAVAAIPAR
jgi:TolA-binding protein